MYDLYIGSYKIGNTKVDENKKKCLVCLYITLTKVITLVNRVPLASHYWNNAKICLQLVSSSSNMFRIK